MKIALINPPSIITGEKLYDRPSFPHLGIASLGAFLRSKSYEIILIDGKFFGYDNKKIIEIVKQHKCDLAGITAMTHEIKKAAELALQLKQKLPEIKTVVGGCHATALPEQTLSEFHGFDFLVFGEGEETFIELIQKLERNSISELHSVKGLAFRINNNISVNPAREYIENLDSLPFPAWDMFPKNEFYPILSSRGCCFKCIFCMRNHGNQIRVRSPENIVNELEYLINNFPVKEVQFYDETLGFHKERFLKLLELMIQRKIGEKIKWRAETRVNILNNENIFKMMKKAGCYYIVFGVESGNQEMLKRIKKDINLEQVVGAVKFAKKAGLKTGSNFILGFPGETKETALDTMNFAVKLNTTYTSIGILVPYPGTEIYKMVQNNDINYKYISFDWSTYNKQIGNSFELNTISRVTLEWIQLKSYLLIYISNFRIKDLMKMSWKYKGQVFAMIMNLFKKITGYKAFNSLITKI